MPLALAGVWGFSEATLFFVVPDVWLTAVAVRYGSRKALRACGFSLAGALAGGAAMYGFGTVESASARAVLDWVPSVAPTMIDEVRQSLASHGLVALFAGPLAGIPYKIYAVEAPSIGIGLIPFLAVSIPARMIRFVLTTMLVAGLSHLLAHRLSERARLRLLLGAWTAFYLLYLSTVPN